MYETQVGVVSATDGTEFTLVVKHVDIDPNEAERLFDAGEQVGNWGWKHQKWTCRDIQHLEEVRAAARYFYGWNGHNEIVRPRSDGSLEFEAYYCC